MIRIKSQLVVLAHALLLGALALAPACGDGDAASDVDSDADGDSGSDVDGACTSTADCEDGFVCLSVGGAGGVCTPQCTASADECGGMASCSAVGALAEVNVCEDDPEDPSAPPKPEEEPQITCMEDAECEALQAGTICVEWKGARSCTIPCAAEADCDLPGAGGVTVDFLACLPDEANDARMGCVPDEACFDDPLMCIGGIPDFP
ncbi:MAG: hypothetical protein H6713_06400 [Myxococcales bacterium]|nr:hypothetical protein [Myxococcales bacterium]